MVLATQMAEAYPLVTCKEEYALESFEGQLRSIRKQLQHRNKLAHRSIKQATVFLYGKSGNGKSTTLNYLFNTKVIPTSESRSKTKIVTEYGCSVKCSHFGEGLNIGFIDNPGFEDTEGEDADAENLAKISYFIKKHPEIGSTSVADDIYPNIALIVVSALDNRLEGTNSSFSKMLNALTKLNVIDSHRPNVLIVVTHAMHLTHKFEEKSKAIRKICNILTRAHFSVEAPVVFIENLDERNEMAQEGDWKILPDGTRQPLNLFDAMINLMMESGDQIGVEAVRMLFSNSKRYLIEPKVKKPENIDLGNDNPFWKNVLKENFFAKRENEIYSILSENISPDDDLLIFPLVYNLHKAGIVRPTDLQHLNLMDVQNNLHPFKMTQEESDWVIRLFGVALITINLDFKSLGLGYSRDSMDSRKRILGIEPMKSVKIGNFEMEIPNPCSLKELKQITIDIVYDENAKWCFMNYLKLTFRICYVLFQVDIDKLEDFGLDTAFVQSLGKSLPDEVAPHNFEHMFQSPNFKDFYKGYALHCTTGLYFGGFCEGTLYFNRRKDVETSRRFLAEKTALLSSQLETYFASIRNGSVPNITYSPLDQDISKKLFECSLTWGGGNKEYHSKTLLGITVNNWNNWTNSLGLTIVCLKRMVNSVSLFTVLSSSHDENIFSYAPKIHSFITGGHNNLADLKFIGSPTFQKENDILTRIEAANRAKTCTFI